MVAYVTITSGRKDQDSPIDTSLIEDLDQNPVAIAEGASGAPRIERPAVEAGVGHRWFYDYGDGTDGAVTDSANRTADPGLYQYTTYQLDASYTLDLSLPGPLVICAQTSIIINGTIDVDGQGGRGGQNSIVDQYGSAGIFGGSGGGSSSKVGGKSYLTDGGDGAAGAAQSAEVRALLLALCPAYLEGGHEDDFLDDLRSGPGGGGGGMTSSDDGGHGGGLVILCAPIITIGSGGVITADGLIGEQTTGGGGGGGAIIIATPASGYTNSGTVAAAAGPATSSGYAGGAGWVEAITL